MDTQGINLGIPSTEEEVLKKKIDEVGFTRILNLCQLLNYKNMSVRLI